MRTLRVCLSFVLGVVGFTTAQRISPLQSSSDLNEISGITALNDSAFVAINDGGDAAVCYVLNQNGIIQRKISISNAQNNDWEAIARDDDFIYIGDIGNNENSRTDLCIYQVSLSDLLTKDTVSANKISFTYKDQQAFPPGPGSLFFDGESLTVMNDSLWIFTKNRNQTGDHSAYVYAVPTVSGNYQLELHSKIYLGDEDWLTQGITSADFHAGSMYLLTYSKLLRFERQGNAFKLVWEYSFDNWAQRESLHVIDSKTFLIAEEKSPFNRAMSLYKLNF